MTERPQYRTSKLAMWFCGGFAWSVIINIVVAGTWFDRRGAIEMAGLVIPSMVAMVIGLLGIHRGFGALDYRAKHRAHRPRADPPQPEEEPHD